MADIPDTWKPMLRPGLILRESRNRFLLVDPDSRGWVVVDAIAAAMICACDGKNTLAQIAERIAPRHGSDLEEPVRLTIQELKLRGFVGDFIDRDVGRPHCCDGPTSLHLEITNRCNLKCSHCYVSAGKGLSHELTLDEIRRIIDEFDDVCVDRDRGVIAITGGEARLRPDCLDILRYAKAKKYATRLFTDAVHFPRQLARALAREGVSVQVSLDGIDAQSNDAIRGSGTFGKIVEGIDTLIEAGLGNDMVLFSVLSRKTIDHALALLDFAEARGIPYLHFSQMNPQGRAAPIWHLVAPTTEQWISFGEKLLHRRQSSVTTVKGNGFGGLDMSTESAFPKMMCEVPSAIRIDCLGNVYPCQLFVEPEHRVGSIRQSTLREVLAGDKMELARERCSKRGGVIEKCRTCPWERVCGGGCPAHAYSEFGTMNHEDSLCDVRIHWFEEFSASLIENRSLGVPLPVCVD